MIQVLVAEDDFVTTRLYQMQFKLCGIVGSFFQTGREALTAAAISAPQVAVLDFHLPDMDGTKIMRELRTIPGCEEVPVIFVTGRATKELERELIDDGASAVLGKPFSPTDLVDRIRQLVGEEISAA